MTFRLLLLRNLAFHWRAHVAVLLGVAVGAAVLTGALLVGDSLRGSLRERAEQQRCGVDLALVRGQFFTAKPDAEHSQTGIILHGSVRAGDEDSARRLNGVTVLAGFDLTEFAGRGGKVQPPALPASLARQLDVQVGDAITLRLPIASTIPSESLLGQRELNQTSLELTVTVASILPDDHPASVFRLQPGFAPPRNVILPLAALQKELAKLLPHLPAPHNAILAAGSREAVEASLKTKFRLVDLGLKWGVGGPDYLSLESYRGVLDETTISRLESGVAPTLVYVANSINHGAKSIPYSVVAALEPNSPPPLGPFLPPGVATLADDEIVLTDWRDSPLLGLKPGDPITLSYFRPELQDGRFVEDRATFKLRGYLPMTSPALGPQLTPAFPGVTDRLSVRDWNPPFPYDNTRMQRRDEEYWRQFRTTPKAIITLSAGRELWASRYGDTTSIRVALPAGEQRAPAQQLMEMKVLSAIDPAAHGFVFDDLKSRFAAASQGGQDFGGLFLGFSFFLIASALLLVGLLTRLNLERRAAEIGLLLATGWRTRTVRWLLLLEGLAVAALGGLIGLGAAVGYAAGMIWLLRELWPDAVAGSYLRLHVAAPPLVIGYFATLLVSAGTIVWALRLLARVAPSALVAGQVQALSPTMVNRPFWQRVLERDFEGLWVRSIILWFVLSVSLTLLACIVGGLVGLAEWAFDRNPQKRALAFFGGGALLLTLALILIRIWLKCDTNSMRMGHGPVALAKLGARNARRNPARSLLTAGLLASAAFLLVAVESFRRRPEGDFLRADGSSGGCPLIVETTQPVFGDLNGDGRDEILTALQRHYQRHRDSSPTPGQRVDSAGKLLSQARIHSFRRSAGDDASCLNLYQAGRPQVLGVPDALINRGGFRFIESWARAPEEKANPWLLLRQTRDDGAIPVIGEQNTITWMLKKGLGDELTIPDETGREVRLRIVAILKDSVFQSELLMSSANFTRLFPQTPGFTFHLVETAPEQAPDVAELLRLGLARREPEVTHSADRVAAYMAVENTYLTTFQLLGGFGLLLGALGLAVVMLRGVWERRGELALLRALGYRRLALGEMVMAENALLLILGLAAGVGSAVLSVLPHLAIGGSIPWLRLGVLLGLVAAAGMAAGLLAVRSTLRAPLLPALRKE